MEPTAAAAEWWDTFLWCTCTAECVHDFFALNNNTFAGQGGTFYLYRFLSLQLALACVLAHLLLFSTASQSVIDGMSRATDADRRMGIYLLKEIKNG